MKTIGLIGGLSWESSAEYYRLINQAVQRDLGGVHSAKILMHSFDFQQIKNLQHDGKWDELTALMIDVAKKLQSAGADMIVICSNTMHKMGMIWRKPSPFPCCTSPIQRARRSKPPKSKP